MTARSSGRHYRQDGCIATQRHSSTVAGRVVPPPRVELLHSLHKDPLHYKSQHHLQQDDCDDRNLDQADGGSNDPSEAVPEANCLGVWRAQWIGETMIQYADSEKGEGKGEPARCLAREGL